MNGAHIDRGKLQVIVMSDTGYQPIAGARVWVSDPQGGTVVEELQTDSSGQTDFFELPAPPLEYSVSESDRQPYAAYGVTVSAPGFERLFTSGVEVLPMRHAIQPVRLRPAAPTGFNVRNLQVAPHTLWGQYPAKEEEDEVKPLPEPTGYIVLPEPVIPETVVVHLGQPDDTSARDIWVPFKDYIKNVASCEIYSTWKTEAIKANVLAILSFTLNRVFTEWYRGKGKAFTVTNSTAFDQAYRENGTIYGEISQVVDDLFTTYVTREGIRQPLFTQYCDGRRTQCRGLSQWGSQALAEQGMDALSILRNYYGADIYLTSAPKVEGVPESYNGVPLKQGSTGEAVRTIQAQLNAVATHYPAIQTLRVDGIYGSKTEDAVKTFQKVFHLPQTGVVDFATWYSISNIYVAVTKMA